MSEENILHAVSHKLYLEKSGNHLHVVITDKNSHILDSSSFTIESSDDLKNLFINYDKLQAIYSKIILINSGCRFVTMPQSITDEKDKKDIYGLSYHTGSDNELLESHIGLQLMVYYEQNRSFLEFLRQRFPKLTEYHELIPLHDAILPKLSDVVNSVVAHVTKDTLLILGFTQGKLIFCNHFQLNGDDDVFYFVMLTIEQLDFDPGYTELILLNDARKDQELTEKFNRFVKKVSNPVHLFDDHSKNRDWANSISFVSQAAIQCA